MVRVMKLERAFVTLACACGLLLPLALSAQSARFGIELEGGPAWQSYNDVEIPNDGSATRISLPDLTGHGPWPAGRLYLNWNVNDRHGVRLLLAPFSLTETGVAPGPVRFAGADYRSGVPLKATYTFNSYRLSYRWRFHAGVRSNAWVGFTGKVRDATIALEQGSTASRKDDVGFVPLLHLSADRVLTERWKLAADVDGLAGGPGRAVDAAVKLGWHPSGRWSVHGGYRMVEGGADVTDVYTFAWLHYAVASVVMRW